MSMLFEVLMHVRKRPEMCWADKNNIQLNTSFTISGGTVTIPNVLDGQYFIIRNSYFNDGLYEYPVNDLTDETSRFDVIPLKIPRAFFELVDEIEEWQNTYGSKTQKPFTSESFDGYSYQRATNSEGQGVSWKDIFKTQLDRWRVI